jgi:hypothetical protein
LGEKWIGFGLHFVLFFIRKSLGWSKGNQLFNTDWFRSFSWVFPVIENLVWKREPETAIIVDQPGTFVVLSALGILVATYYSRGTARVLILKNRPPLRFIKFTIAGVEYFLMMIQVFSKLNDLVFLLPCWWVTVGV